MFNNQVRLGADVGLGGGGEGRAGRESSGMQLQVTNRGGLKSNLFIKIILVKYFLFKV